MPPAIDFGDVTGFKLRMNHEGRISVTVEAGERRVAITSALVNTNRLASNGHSLEYCVIDDFISVGHVQDSLNGKPRGERQK